MGTVGGPVRRLYTRAYARLWVVGRNWRENSAMSPWAYTWSTTAVGFSRNTARSGELDYEAHLSAKET
jgi:hypothetical protein